MKVMVIGCGYVGLVTAVGLAECGHEVVCCDQEKFKIEMLQKEVIPFFEPGLEELLKRQIQVKRLRFSFATSKEISELKPEVVLLAVGTPQGLDGQVDLSAIKNVAQDLAKSISSRTVLAIKSTVPVGTGDLIEAIVSHNPNVIDVVSNPEFLKEGNAVQDFMHPSRVIVGTSSEKALQMMTQLYKPLMVREMRLIAMNRRSAEITKYAANGILASRISLINEIARLCEATGAHMDDVRKGMIADPRIGSSFLYPGPGYGGSCFPKDIQAIVAMGEKHGVSLDVLQGTHKSNLKQRGFIVEKILNRVMHIQKKQHIQNPQVTLWGLSFKAHTDDIRESIALSGDRITIGYQSTDYCP